MWLLTTSLIKAKPDSQDLFFTPLTWETQFVGIRKEESARAAALKLPNMTLKAFGAQRCGTNTTRQTPGREQKVMKKLYEEVSQTEVMGNYEKTPEVKSVGLNSRCEGLMGNVQIPKTPKLPKFPGPDHVCL